MVIGVADDAGMHSSQNEQDSRHYAAAAKLPMLEPADAAESLAFAKLAYELSEQFDTPVLLQMCTRIAHSQSVVETGERVPSSPRQAVRQRRRKVHHDARQRQAPPPGGGGSGCATSRPGPRRRSSTARSRERITAVGILTSAHVLSIRQRGLRRHASPVLKLGMIHPLPVQKILDFAARRSTS